MKKARFFCIFGIMIILTNSCGVPPQIPSTGIAETTNATTTAEATSNALFEKYGINVSVTDDKTYPVLAVGKNGEQLIAITDSTLSGNASTVTGAVWFSSEDESFVLFNGKDGLPEKVVIGELTIILFNYTDSSVDVGIIGANGETETLKNISLDAEILSELKALQSKTFTPSGANKLAIPASASEVTNMEAILEIASFGLELAGCVASVAALTAVTFGAVLVALALPCGTLLIDTVITLTKNEDTLFASAFASANMGGTSKDCISGTLIERRLACAALIIDATKLAISKANELISNLTDEITLAQDYFSIRIYEGIATYTNKTDVCTCDNCGGYIQARVVISQDGSVTGEVVDYFSSISGTSGNITGFYTSGPNNCDAYCDHTLVASLKNNGNSFTGTIDTTCTPGNCAFDNCGSIETFSLTK